ncbi:MAG: translation initiation factor IF-2 N-terminal domain-containing protein, partial [Muribaculaceae bacterium]|nr:translation initiation factor IF-2 N-terminal domain-containing protein [Muribaculaceae bacterium]
MAKTKISKVAKDLNVSVATVIDFLRKKNIEIDENPNTRLEDNMVEMLMSAFQSDKDLKNRSEQKISERRENRVRANERPAKPVEESKPVENNGPRILGRLELDAKGNPVVRPKDAPAPEKKAAPAPAPVVEKKPEPAPAPAPAPEKKPEPAPAPAPAPVKKPAPTPAPAPEKKAAPAPAPVAEKKQEPAPASTPAPAAGNDVFKLESSAPAPSINIVGKIDLEAMNLNTRPKKKTKEERRSARPGAPANGNEGDRKKRRRITGKEKVDIEKAGRQAADNNNRNNNNNDSNRGNRQGGGGGQQRNNDNRRNNNAPRQDRNRRPAPQPAEVSEEDVQKQVKETLARLTAKDKGLKKGAKWRKEKREAIASREREAARAEQAESRVLKITEFVTANDLAVMMDVPVNNVIATCMNIGVMVSINQRLDAETINIVAEEFGFTTEYVSAEVADALPQEEDSEDDLLCRPPV